METRTTSVDDPGDDVVLVCTNKECRTTENVRATHSVSMLPYCVRCARDINLTNDNKLITWPSGWE